MIIDGAIDDLIELKWKDSTEDLTVFYRRQLYSSIFGTNIEKFGGVPLGL